MHLLKSIGILAILLSVDTDMLFLIIILECLSNGALLTIRKAIKGAWISLPLPKYTRPWDVQKVLDCLVEHHPPEILDIKLLSHKTFNISRANTFAPVRRLYYCKANN